LRLGFGFVEVGGVTPKPQTGNPKPRVFRLPEDGAIINRIGLNSEGHTAVAARLAAFRESEAAGAAPGIISVNLAKNTDSPSAEADYCAGVRVLGPHVDVLVANVSCPNVAWTKALAGDVRLV
jgi:dihydroorotate dehydrogenase